MDYLLKESDFVVNLLPLVDENRKLFNMDVFKKNEEREYFH